MRSCHIYLHNKCVRACACARALVCGIFATVCVRDVVYYIGKVSNIFQGTPRFIGTCCPYRIHQATKQPNDSLKTQLCYNIYPYKKHSWNAKIAPYKFQQEWLCVDLASSPKFTSLSPWMLLFTSEGHWSCMKKTFLGRTQWDWTHSTAVVIPLTKSPCECSGTPSVTTYGWQGTTGRTPPLTATWNLYSE
jgi:hypothetical protein